MAAVNKHCMHAGAKVMGGPGGHRCDQHPGRALRLSSTMEGTELIRNPGVQHM